MGFAAPDGRAIQRRSNKGASCFGSRSRAVSCWLAAAAGSAAAETPAERGDYLVNTIMACGNCHSPRDAEGRLIPGKAFSGGLTFVTPPFTATAPNITPDAETGIGSWSDAEIKRALVEGMRPDHGHLAGVPLAAIMPANFYRALLPEDLDAVVAYLRTVKPIRSEVPDPVYKAPVRRDALSRRRGRFQQGPCSPIRSGAALISSPSAIAWNATPAWSRGVSDFKNGLGRRRQGISAARRGACGSADQHRRQHHLRPHRRHRRLERCQKSAAPSRKELARDGQTAQAADGLWLLCGAEASRSRRHHRLSAHVPPLQ